MDYVILLNSFFLYQNFIYFYFLIFELIIYIFENIFINIFLLLIFKLYSYFGLINDFNYFFVDYKCIIHSWSHLIKEYFISFDILSFLKTHERTNFLQVLQKEHE